MFRSYSMKNINHTIKSEYYVFKNNYKEKYREMIIGAAETVLGHFGFDRNLYGDNKKNISKGKWWWLEELRQERERDIKILELG